MDYTDHFPTSQQENFLSGAGTGAAAVKIQVGTRLPRKPSLRTNFSYPNLSRHESSESRSSNGSVPGMTDTSDSDLSFDDDCIYNTSAGQLWDSFWPVSTTLSNNREFEERHPDPRQAATLQPGICENHVQANPATRCPSGTGTDDDTIRLSTRGEHEVEEPITESRPLKPSRLQTAPKKTPVTYSVYPRPSVLHVQKHPHPPRTSSLLTHEPPEPPRRPLFLRGSRSTAGLKPSKSTHNIHSLLIAPPPPMTHSKADPSQPAWSTAAHTTVSVPVSPAYPPPPAPKTLRPSKSAFNIRDKTRAYYTSKSGLVPHSATGPPTPRLPCPSPLPLPARPQVERFVSVFELDTDSEAERDVADEANHSFAKRIARGLHKKSASEKRGVTERKAMHAGFAFSDVDASEKDTEAKPRCSGNPARTRGGSLGRIFGLKGR